jgi:hypothetical protein
LSPLKSFTPTRTTFYPSRHSLGKGARSEALALSRKSSKLSAKGYSWIPDFSGMTTAILQLAAISHKQLWLIPYRLPLNSGFCLLYSINYLLSEKIMSTANEGFVNVMNHR